MVDQGEIECTIVFVEHVIHYFQQMMTAAAVALIDRPCKDPNSNVVRQPIPLLYMLVSVNFSLPLLGTSFKTQRQTIHFDTSCCKCYLAV